MKRKDNIEKWSLLGSLGAALAAAACCIGPLLLVSFGVTGAWIGNISALEAFRPFFMVGAGAFLLVAFYRVYAVKADPQKCGDSGDGECVVPQASQANRISLWVASAVVAGLFASPHLIALGAEDINEKPAAESHEALSTITLEIEGMTCTGCIPSVRRALRDVDGVAKIEVSFDPPEAQIRFDASRTNSESLIEAVARVGYSAEPIN